MVFILFEVFLVFFPSITLLQNGHLIFMQLVYIQVIAYIYFVVKIIMNIKVKDKNILWKRSFLVIFLSAYLMDLMQVEAMLAGFKLPFNPHHLFFGISGAFLSYYITITILLRNDFLKNGNGKKYAKSSLDQDQKDKLIERMDNFIKLKEPFLDDTYCIVDMSKDLNVPRNHISQVLNEQLNVKFYDYLNKYRIEKVKLLMNDPDLNHFSLLGLAKEAGFKNKTTFISSFRKVHGVTPSYYKKNLIKHVLI